MDHKKGRYTQSKIDCICQICGHQIYKADAIWIEPGKLVCHHKCYKYGRKQEEMHS